MTVNIDSAWALYIYTEANLSLALTQLRVQTKITLFVHHQIYTCSDWDSTRPHAYNTATVTAIAVLSSVHTSTFEV